MLAPDLSTAPYWTDGFAPFVPPPREIGRKVDVAIVTLVCEYQIECGLRVSGRIIAAHSPRAVARLEG